MRFRLFKLQAGMLLFCACFAVQALAIRPPSQAAKGTQTYIVQFVDPPLAVYEGGETFFGESFAYASAKSQGGFTPESASSQVYLDYLDRARQRILGNAGFAQKSSPEFVYRYAYNGVALELTSKQAGQLEDQPGIKSVHRATRSHLLTDAGPEWIGADEVWSGSAAGSGDGTQGEGVIVGIIDSGIAGGHPSFDDIGGDRYNHTNPRGRLYGICFTQPFRCNDKLIGIFDFTDEGSQGRDTTGHGTHVASTAAGNHVVATLESETSEFRVNISGVAPHANIIAYKVCVAGDPDEGTEGGCNGEAILKAIEKATANRVDVINYSIGSNVTVLTPWEDPIAVAFRNARQSGIVISVSAGNSGPLPASLGLPATAPWVISVANSTHNRLIANKLTDFSGGTAPIPETLTGAGFTLGYGPKEIVHARESGFPLCGKGEDIDFPPVGSSNPFAPNTFNGEIVVCDRGIYARVTKGYNLKKAGAGGMVLVNTEAQGESIVSDDHYLPAVHLGFEDGEILRTWLDSGTGVHMARITGTQRELSEEFADILNSSSSRGPAILAENVLKPDVTAPGTNILAAFPVQNGEQFAFLTGTSMSSPHVAGAVALLTARRPGWSPGEVKSALMLTSVDSGLEDGAADGTITPFGVGAGRIDVSQAINTGLLMSETEFGNGAEPQNLNLPSMANARCFLECSWQRSVHAAQAGITWEVSVEAPEGIEVSVTPQTFTLQNVNDAQQLNITADVEGAAIGEWFFGSVRLVPGDPSIPEAHLPLAVKVFGGNLPAEINITTDLARGWETITLDGLVTLPAATLHGYGLANGRRVTLNLPEDATRDDPFNGGSGTFSRLEQVRDGDKFLLAQVLSSTATDIDLYVGFDFNDDGQAQVGELLCVSASQDATERCFLENPSAGQYWVLVQNWDDGTAARDSVEFVSVVVPGSGVSLTATGPGQVAAREEFSVRLSWAEGAIQSGDLWYGALGVGTDPEHPDNIGLIPVVLERTSITHRPVVMAPSETLQFTLQPGTAHEGIYIDLPPNATRLVIDLDSRGDNGDLYARKGEPLVGDTAQELAASADAAATESGVSERLIVELGADDAPARWYIAPFLPGGSQTTFSLVVLVETDPGSINPLQGMWLNTQRLGHGIELNHQGNVRYLIWYTYLEDGTPVWYIGSQAKGLDNVWTAPLNRFVWDGTQGYPTQVGQVIVTFESEDEIVFSWRLFGESGSEHFVHAEGILFESDNPPAINHTGGWYPPLQPGWGDTVVTKGGVELHTLYLYDRNGEPRWVQGLADEASSVVELFAFSNGFCPICSFTSPIREPVGGISTTYDSQTTGIFDVDVAFPPPYGGTWVRENVAVEMLSQPVE